MERLFVHRVDSEDRVVYVNDEWLAFAAENDTPEITRKAVLNRPIWDFIEDQETRSVFADLFDRVRKSMSAVSVPFRCDSPDRIRKMSMEIVPLLEGELQFNCRMLHEEARAPIALLDPKAERSDGMIKICSWCKRVEVGEGRWMELERAIADMDLFGEKRPPQTTGSICDACRVTVFGKRWP